MLNSAQLFNPKLTPATLTHYLDPKWIPAKHLAYISAKVAAGIKRGGARIIVSVPPRHGKSRMLSIGTTVWTLEEFPEYFVGICSYGRDLSTDFSGAVRDQIEQNPEKLDVRLRQGSNRIDRFLTNRNGGVFAVGLGGPLTGRGFHVFLLDDYIKQLKEALSQTYKTYAWEWFRTTAMTRLEPGASVVIVATRWVEDDIIGMILKEDPESWDYVRIPAIAEEGDVLGRVPGEPLFPERYPIAELERIKKLLGSRWFGAIYQQDPSDDESKITRKEWLRYADHLPSRNVLRWGRFWDLAGTQGGGDYTCGLLAGGSKLAGRLFLADMQRVQYSPENTEKLVLQTAEKDGKDVPIYIEEDPGAAGKIVISNYKKLLKGYQVTAIPTMVNKVVKAQGVAAGAERGDLVLQKAGWNKDFEDEWDSFGPDAAHDDQIDVVSDAWNTIIGKHALSATWGSKDLEPQVGADGEASVAIRGEAPAPTTGATWGRRDSGLLVPKASMRVRRTNYHE